MFKWLTDKFKKAGKHDDDSYPNIVRKSGYIPLSGKLVEPDKVEDLPADQAQYLLDFVEHDWVYAGCNCADNVCIVKCTKYGQQAGLIPSKPPKYGCTG